MTVPYDGSLKENWFLHAVISEQRHYFAACDCFPEKAVFSR